jgi:lysophospholipase
MLQNNRIARKSTFSPYDFLTTPDQQSLRYGIWSCQTEKRKGSVILLNGRREFMEKYSETIVELNQKGFDVYSFDWRGQGLSSRMLANRHKGFIKNYDAYLNDLHRFVSKIVKPQAVYPLIIMAHSMGGHIALRYIHDHPDIADMAVLTSPMIDIFTSPMSRWLVRFIARIAISVGFKHAYAMGSGDHVDEEFKGNKLTSDPVRFMDAKKAIAENPDLALGGVTYGWLSAMLRSIDIITRPGFAEKIATPILMVGAGDDKIVSNNAQKKICALLPNCRRIEIPGARHEIFIETDAVRAILWQEFDRFAHAGVDP